jgi:hypothetical protein
LSLPVICCGLLTVEFDRGCVVIRLLKAFDFCYQGLLILEN